MNKKYKEPEIGDIINGKWEVIDTFYEPVRNTKQLFIEVRCLECGYIDNGRRDNIYKRKNCKHCKELRVQSMVGQRYGRLIVERISDKRGKQGHILAECVCDCGNRTIVSISKLNSGHTRSCGCLEAEGNNYTHRMSNTRIYKIWKGIKTRCYNPNANTYSYYGGRGIKMCDEWLNDFMAFYEWAINNGYTDELSIDRIDPDGDYSPYNCRWITMQEQQRNKSNTIHIYYNDDLYTIGELAEYYGCTYKDLKYRYYNGELNTYLNQAYYNNMQNIINQIHNNTINQDYYNMRCNR